MSDLTKPSVVPDDTDKGEGFHKHGDRGHYHPLTGPQPHTHGIDLPSHEDDVQRGFGQTTASDGMNITNYTRDEGRVISRLAAAMDAELAFMNGGASAWEIAASGILSKMGASVTSVEDEVAIVHIPLTN